MWESEMVVAVVKRWVLFVMVVCFSASVACNSYDSEDTDTGFDAGPDTSEELEESMCAGLESSTGGIVQAGEELGEGSAINPNSGLESVDLKGSGDQMGGYVEIQAPGDAELLVLVREDVPLEILDQNGDNVPDVEYSETPESCPGAASRHSWLVV